MTKERVLNNLIYYAKVTWEWLIVTGILGIVILSAMIISVALTKFWWWLWRMW